jgi:hypothetical protein
VLVWTLLIGCGRLRFDDQPSVDAATETAGPFFPLTLHADGFATTSTTFVDIPEAELTIPPSVGRRWFVVLAGAIESSMALGVSVEAPAIQARRYREPRQPRRRDGADAHAGLIAVARTAPPAVTASFGSGDGLEVQYFSSEVLMLGLR